MASWPLWPRDGRVGSLGAPTPPTVRSVGTPFPFPQPRQSYHTQLGEKRFHEEKCSSFADKNSPSFSGQESAAGGNYLSDLCHVLVACVSTGFRLHCLGAETAWTSRPSRRWHLCVEGSAPQTCGEPTPAATVGVLPALNALLRKQDPES